MGVLERNELLECIDILKARDFLDGMTLSLVPQMKNDSYRKLHREFHKRGFPKLHREKQVLTPKEIQERLAKGRR